MSNRLLVAMFCVVALAGAAATGLTVAWVSFAPLLVAIGMLGCLAGYCRMRAMRALAQPVEDLALVTATFFAGLILSYVAARSPAPMADRWLHALDRRLGFDWWSYLALFDAHPVLARLEHLIYQSMIPQLGLATFALSLWRPRAARQFVAAVTIALATTCLVSTLTPAVGIYALLDVDLARFPHLHPATTFQAVVPLEQLRAGGFAALVRQDSVGLISFPSFHCAAGTLLIWAGWQFRLARWPAAAVNLALIASTPVEGAHYLVDGIAGVLVATVALAAARRLHASSPLPTPANVEPVDWPSPTLASVGAA